MPPHFTQQLVATLRMGPCDDMLPIVCHFNPSQHAIFVIMAVVATSLGTPKTHMIIALHENPAGIQGGCGH